MAIQEIPAVEQAIPPQTAEKPAIDVTQTYEVRVLKHDSPLLSCRYDPTGKFLFFGAQDQRVWRWQLDGEQKTELAGHDSWVRAIAFDNTGQTLITGGFDGRLIWWAAASEKPEPLRKVDAHQGWIRAAAVSPDNSLVATAGSDNLVKLWRLDNGELVRELAGHERHVYNVAFHPDGKQLASGDLMGNLFHWEVETGKLARQFKLEALHKYDGTFMADIGGMRAMEFSKDGKLIGCAGITNVSNAFAGVGNPIIEIWDWEAGQQKIQHQSKGKLVGVAWGMALHPEGFTIGVSGGSGGGFLLFWKADEKEEFHQLKLADTARDMHLSPDLLHVATAHFDGHVRIHRLTAKA